LEFSVKKGFAKGDFEICLLKFDDWGPFLFRAFLRVRAHVAKKNSKLIEQSMLEGIYNVYSRFFSGEDNPIWMLSIKEWRV